MGWMHIGMSVKTLQWRHNGHDGVSNHQFTIVYSTVYSGANRKTHQSSASLAFVRGIHRWPVNSPHKWPVTRKMFPFDDVIMGWIIYTRPGTYFREKCALKLLYHICRMSKKMKLGTNKLKLDFKLLPKIYFFGTTIYTEKSTSKFDADLAQNEK